MTSIGRFSLKTETETNPSVPTLFIALSPPMHNANDVITKRDSSMNVSEFESVWNQREIPRLHPRFHYKVSSMVDGHFEDKEDTNTINKSDDSEKIKDDSTKEVNLSRGGYVTETVHMNVYRTDLKKRIEDLVSTAIPCSTNIFTSIIYTSGTSFALIRVGLLN